MIAVKPFDILTFEGDAIVNPANIGLFGGGGLDGVIHSRVGYTKLTEYMDRYRDFSMYGGAYPSPAYELPCKHIIHAVGIEYFDPRCRHIYDELYRNIATVCRILDINSVAIPAIGMGIFGVPIDKGAEWMADGMQYFKDIDVTIATIDPAFEQAIKEAI